MISLLLIRQILTFSASVSDGGTPVNGDQIHFQILTAPAEGGGNFSGADETTVQSTNGIATAIYTPGMHSPGIVEIQVGKSL